MRTYIYEGREYVESGEVRIPKAGEHYVSSGPHFYHLIAGGDSETSRDENEGRRKILIPKEEQVSEDYNIPVLVKATADIPSRRNEYRRYAGKVVMCKEGNTGLKGPVDALGPGDDGFVWYDDGIPYPTREQVEAEQAELKAKADPLPAPVRQALDAADLGCRRDGVAKLVEAIYSNPPKAEA